MEGGAEAALDELLTCVKCQATYALARSEERGRMRLSCSSCGDARDLVVAPPGAGRFTLVDPQGNVSQFASFAELAASRAPAVEAAPPARSGASLLDTTPTPAAPKLALADSDREMEAAPKTGPEEEQPLSSRDFVEVDRPKAEPKADEDEPLSTRDFVQVVKAEAPRVSKAPPIPERASRAPEPPKRASEPPPPPKRASEPPPPPRGALKTLPPEKPELPPPTIAIEDAPKSKRPAAVATPAQPDEKRSSWLLPGLGIAAAGALVWLLARDASQTEPAPVATTPPVAPSTAPVPTPSASEDVPASIASSAPSASASPSASAIASAAPSASAAPPASAEARKPLDVDALPLSALLERAGAARRSGDRARAKTLYDKALEKNPGNAEAFAGLGELARASGDLPGAKDAFQKALATSPAYLPAQIGLADVEWDLGNQAAAKQRYAEIAERLGPNAPARVRERLGEAAPQ